MKGSNQYYSLVLQIRVFKYIYIQCQLIPMVWGIIISGMENLQFIHNHISQEKEFISPAHILSLHGIHVRGHTDAHS